MDDLHSYTVTFSLLFLLLLLHFSSLQLLSSAYTLPEKYFVNCGSDSTATYGSRTFVGDLNSGSFSVGKSIPVKNTNTTPGTSILYQTARIYRYPSWYEFGITENGTYLVRLHFFPFSSPTDLSAALFNVSALGFSLLSNFSVRIDRNLPVVEEFVLNIEVDNFRIYFTPCKEASFAFINAIEVFITPEGFISGDPPLVTPAGSDKHDRVLLSHGLRTVYRINVGGRELTPDNDTLLRSWIPDDGYLFFNGSAKNSEFYSGTPNYQQGVTEYIAPFLVYQTAKELNIDSNRTTNFFNITWRFEVSKNARHLVRAHFCDIVSPSLNAVLFNFYIDNQFSKKIDPYNVIPQLAAPFYFDFMVDSDDSGVMNISVGPRRDSMQQTAFLNGLEIMEVCKDSRTLVMPSESRKKSLSVIVGSVAGAVALIFILVAVLFLGLKYVKAKTVKNFESPSIPLYGGGGSFSWIIERTANSSPFSNMNLGLKIPLAEILKATNNFDAKLMIGEGGFGKVYKGIFGDGVKVAVKRSEPGHGQGLPEFQTEILVLSQIRHRHLVSLIGYCDDLAEMILVYEFMENGTLRDHLYDTNANFNITSRRPALSWKQRLEICIGSAQGLHYLHTGSGRGIIHRDVKSTNILLDDHYVAKVADFGLSRAGPLDQTHVSTEVKGSFGYLDPEYFRCLQLTEKSDVYSFGVVLLEVLCARPAINSLLPREQINLAEWGISWQRKGRLQEIVDPSLAGKINPNSLRKFGEIVEKCLKEYGVERPPMSDVLWDLEYALQLQQTGVRREPHEDSTTDASLGLSLPAVQGLPSCTFSIEEDGKLMELMGRNDLSDPSASGVFSQLMVDHAR
ncbi:probable receptor-like protein kinase At5g24010 [Malania oleifera]|uniref:probable receptor-like protein kinase At5g24010 n=1 Tax=Malania oleifera TaxID=397392 RepID=UPI0025AE7BF6|nr:probable receptor-like protein kinase At5g24010 [Malania oleifera]